MRTTAALHPPLLVTCVRASQKASFHRRTIVQQHKSGGRQPPVAGHRPRHNEPAEHKRYCATASAHPTNCGGRQPPVALINANATAIRTHTVGGLPTNGARVCRCAFAHPRRAHARRSWYCASVHRKHRFFAGRRPHTNTRAGGVSPPVAGHRARHNEPAKHKRCCAIASAHPTGKKRTLNANGCVEGRSGRNHLKSSLSIHPAKAIGVSSRRTFHDNRDSEGRPYICRNR